MSSIRRQRSHRLRLRVAGGARSGRIAVAMLALSAALAIAPRAHASHTVITASDTEFAPIGSDNLHKVYLSSPRHSDSGSRGELGWEENINGRHWNYYAATGNYKNGSSSTSTTRNLRARGYHVRVSANSRDGGYLHNRTASNNWGADVHIATHTNALAGSGTGNYMLIMVDDATATSSDTELRSQLDERLGDQVPGTEVLTTDNSNYTGNLAELSANADYNVYVELIFHDNSDHVDWFGSGGDWGRSVKYHAWRYGYAVDQALGYP